MCTYIHIHTNQCSIHTYTYRERHIECITIWCRSFQVYILQGTCSHNNDVCVWVCALLSLFVKSRHLCTPAETLCRRWRRKRYGKFPRQNIELTCERIRLHSLNYVQVPIPTGSSSRIVELNIPRILSWNNISSLYCKFPLFLQQTKYYHIHEFKVAQGRMTAKHFAAMKI